MRTHTRWFTSTKQQYTALELGDMLKQKLLLGGVPNTALPFTAVKKIPQEGFNVMFTVLAFKQM